jgi:hypothetical protein
VKAVQLGHRLREQAGGAIHLMLDSTQLLMGTAIPIAQQNIQVIGTSLDRAQRLTQIVYQVFQ